MIDLKLTGGEVIDGTGSPGFFAIVLVNGDNLTIHRGDASHIPAARTIDANGHVVCPGFVDVHSHGGFTIMREPRHEPKVRQGVTTELIGIDGNSFAPFKTQDKLHRFIELDCGLNDWPPLPADWLSVGEYLDKYDGLGSVNVCYILGNSPARIWSVGWDDRPATIAELADMRSVVRQAMEEGAWGLSTGLDYPPGSFASTDELVELCREATRLGGFYHTHTRASRLAQGRLAPWEEAVEIGRRSGVPVHFTHYRQSAQGVGSHHDYLGLVERSREEGLDVTFDCYSYPYSGTRATILLPQWTMEGGPERLKRALRDPSDRDRIRRELRDSPAIRVRYDENWLTNFTLPQNRRYDGWSIAEIAEDKGVEPIDALCDLLAEEGLGIATIGLGTNAHTLPAFVTHPYGMIGSDAMLFGEHPNPRAYGCFVLVLAEFALAERQMRLPEAIRKMTSFPAQRIGLPDRGILRDGFKADIVIFDKQRVKTRATLKNPKVFPEGIPYVIVDGTVVVDGGEHTGALPGRALRRGHPST